MVPGDARKVPSSVHFGAPEVPASTLLVTLRDTAIALADFLGQKGHSELTRP